MQTYTYKNAAADDTFTLVNYTFEQAMSCKTDLIAEITAKIEKLQNSLDELAIVPSEKVLESEIDTLFAAKIKKGEILAESYDYADLFTKKPNMQSLSGFLTAKGLDKKLHGSCNRAHNIGKAVLAALVPAGLDYIARRAALINAIGGQNSLWQPMLLEFLGYASEEEATN